MKNILIYLFIILVMTGCISIGFNAGKNFIEKDVSSDVSTEETVGEVDWSDLKYCAFGDSITYGAIGNSQMNSPYPETIGNLLNIGYTKNHGHPGATIATPTTERGCITDYVLGENGYFDIISVLGGVNDFSLKNPLGTSSDTTKDTIYGGYDVIARHLTTNYPNAFIFFVTPLSCGWATQDQGQGYILSDVINAIKVVAQRYNIPVLDLYTTSGFEPRNTLHADDTLHPSQWFVTNKLAPQIAQFIKDNYNK